MTSPPEVNVLPAHAWGDHLHHVAADDSPDAFVSVCGFQRPRLLLDRTQCQPINDPGQWPTRAVVSAARPVLHFGVNGVERIEPGAGRGKAIVRVEGEAGCNDTRRCRPRCCVASAGGRDCAGWAERVCPSCAHHIGPARLAAQVGVRQFQRQQLIENHRRRKLVTPKIGRRHHCAIRAPRKRGSFRRPLRGRPLSRRSRHFQNRRSPDGCYGWSVSGWPGQGRRGQAARWRGAARRPWARPRTRRMH